MAVLCLPTNTPWPWPTPAGAASARGGFPTLGTERERSGGGVAQRRSAQAQRGRLGCLLSRARDGVPQEAWLPCFARSAGDRISLLQLHLGVGVAGGKGPARSGGDGRVGRFPSPVHSAGRGQTSPYSVGKESYGVTFVLLCDMVELLEYINASGISPFAKWRGKLDPTTRARITVGVLRLELGNFSAAKGVGGGIFELRFDFGPGYR